MKDWKLLAAALRLDIDEADLERIAPPLDAMDAVFRPLIARIPHETEPAIRFGLPEESQ